jgi:hypothetical protein
LYSELDKINQPVTGTALRVHRVTKRFFLEWYRQRRVEMIAEGDMDCPVAIDTRQRFWLMFRQSASSWTSDLPLSTSGTFLFCLLRSARTPWAPPKWSRW